MSPFRLLLLCQCLVALLTVHPVCAASVRGLSALRHPYTGPAVPVTMIPTYQIVPNPLYLPEVDPIMASSIVKRIEELDAERVRFCPWFPYPRLTIAQLYEPTEGRQCM